MRAFLRQVSRRQIDGHPLRRQRQAGGVEGGLHALAAFGNRLVRQADDLHPDLSGSDHDLDLDRHTFDTLKCNRTDTRDHQPIPLPQTFIYRPAAIFDACRGPKTAAQFWATCIRASGCNLAWKPE